MIWHFYGIMASQEAPSRWEYFENVQLETYQFGLVSALVSAPLKGQTLEQVLLHNEIIEMSMAQVTLLPARFAAPVSLGALEQFLNNPQGLLERLRVLRGKKEFAIRAELKPHDILTDTSSGRAYLLSKQAAQKIAQHNANLCQELQAVLERHLPYQEIRVLETDAAKFRLAFLVAQTDFEVFAAQCQMYLTQFKDQFLHLSLHGAFAPYSFTQPQE